MIAHLRKAAHNWLRPGVAPVTLAPVSYTHLCNVMAMKNAPAPEEEEEPEENASFAKEPVSYTHLDVYKRQVPPLRGSSARRATT